MGLAFDAGPKFGFDKAAGEACRHLTQHGCEIHALRVERGFQGCIDYDCLGAGQRVTALFAGRTWRDDDAQLRPMLDAFAAMRRVHEQIELLKTAGNLPLTPADQAVRDALEAALWRDDALEDFAPLLARVKAFLTSLGGYVAAKA